MEAMIAKYIDGAMEPVATIDIGDLGFTFEASDPGLRGILRDVKENGLEVWSSNEAEDGGKQIAEGGQSVQVTLDNSDLFETYLRGKGFTIWREV